MRCAGCLQRLYTYPLDADHRELGVVRAPRKVCDLGSAWPNDDVGRGGGGVAAWEQCKPQKSEERRPERTATMNVPNPRLCGWVTMSVQRKPYMRSSQAGHVTIRCAFKGCRRGKSEGKRVACGPTPPMILARMCLQSRGKQQLWPHPQVRTYHRSGAAGSQGT